MSTRGIWAIPTDSPDSYFFITAVYAALGVPIMAFAMSQMSSLLFSSHTNQKDFQTIKAKATNEEVKLMPKFAYVQLLYNMYNRDNTVYRGEFLALSLLRIGELTYELLDAVMLRFDELDTSGDEVLQYRELIQQHDDLHHGQHVIILPAPPGSSSPSMCNDVGAGSECVVFWARSCSWETDDQ
jgi:hypothetical protein